MVDAKIIHKDGIPYLVEAEIYSLNHKLGIIDECNRSIARETAIIKYLVESGDNTKNNGISSKIKGALSFVWEKIKEIARTIRDAISNFFAKIKSFFSKNKVAEQAKKKAGNATVTYTYYNIENLSRTVKKNIDTIYNTMYNFYMDGALTNKVDDVKKTLNSIESLGSINSYSTNKTDTESKMVNDLLATSKYLDQESKNMESSIRRTCDRLKSLEQKSNKVNLGDKSSTITIGTIGATDKLQKMLNEFNSIAGQMMKNIADKLSSYTTNDEDDFYASMDAESRSTDALLKDLEEDRKKIQKRTEDREEELMQINRSLRNINKPINDNSSNNKNKKSKNQKKLKKIKKELNSMDDMNKKLDQSNKDLDDLLKSI